MTPQACRAVVSGVAFPRARCSHGAKRNVLDVQHVARLIIFTGFFEPVFYLGSIGLGLGAMVPGSLRGCQLRAFVVPSLASSCLNSAITDSFFNIFFKLHFEDLRRDSCDYALPASFGQRDAVGDHPRLDVCGGVSAGRACAGTHHRLAALLLSRWRSWPQPAAVLVMAAACVLGLCSVPRDVAKKIQDFDAVMGLLVTDVPFRGDVLPGGIHARPSRFFVFSCVRGCVFVAI